jgi:O-antigen/teichoic acid export membrane protein
LSTRPTEAIFGPALVLMSGRALGFIAAFAVPLVLARVFSQHEFGTYKQVFLIYSTLFGIVQAGMAESLYYFLPAEKDRKGRYIVNVLMVLGGLGLAALLLLYSQQDRIAALLNNAALAPYLVLTGIYLVLMLMSLVLEIVMTAEKQHVSASFAYALTDLGRAILFLVPVFFFGGLFWLLLGAIAFGFGRLAYTLFYLKREFGTGLQADHDLMKKQLGYALPFGLAGLIEVVQINFHMYVVSWYFDAATFAIYSVGCLQLPITDFLMTSTSNVVMVQMREKLRAGDLAAVVAIWLDGVRKLALVLFPMIGILLVLAHELIVVMFTDSYASAVPVFIVWTIGMLLATILSDSVLRVYAENRFLIIQNFIRLAVLAALIHWFLALFGLVGAVLVTLLANLVARSLGLMRVKTLLGVRFGQLLPWKSLAGVFATAAGAAVPVLLLKATRPVEDFLQLAIGGTLYVITYYLLLLWLGPLHADEKHELVRWTQMPMVRLRRALKA